MSYDIGFHLMGPGDELLHMGAPAELRARLDALFEGGIDWSQLQAKVRAQPLVRWLVSTELDSDKVLMVLMLTSYGLDTEERYRIAQRVCDATGWTALDMTAGARRPEIRPGSVLARGESQ